MRRLRNDFDRMRACESRRADKRCNAVAPQLIANDFDLAFDHALHAMREVAGRDPVADDVVLAVKRPLPETGEV